jgi:hypothetical protein
VAGVPVVVILGAGASRCSALDLDAVGVGAPVGDAFFDCFGFEVLGEGFADQGGDFGVRGETQGYELLDREFADVGSVFSREERGETETLFETDDAVLGSESGTTGGASHYEEDDGHGDPPEVSVLVAGPRVNCGVDGKDEVKQEHGQNEEVKRWIEARVVLEILRGGHRISSSR